jgi:ABC-type amino acid transport substrate-binding protein
MPRSFSLFVLLITLLFISHNTFAKLTLVATPVPSLISEDAENGRLNKLITQALTRANIEADLTVMRPAFSGSGLLTGKLDGDFAHLALAEQGDQFVYSDIYLPIYLYLASRQSSLDDISKYSHVLNSRVATENRFANTPTMRLVKDVSWARNPSAFDAFRQIAQDRADYLLTDKLLLDEFNRLLQQAKKPPLKLSKSPLTVTGLQLTLQKKIPNSAQLIQRFNEVINEMQQDGSFNQMLQIKWLRKDINGDGQGDFITHTAVVSSASGTDALNLAYPLDNLSPGPNSRYYVDGKEYPFSAAIVQQALQEKVKSRASLLDPEVYQRMIERW